MRDVILDEYGCELTEEEQKELDKSIDKLFK